jgi:phospholipid/cholesterol/gamma-HCH transport system substrate-binding protein
VTVAKRKRAPVLQLLGFLGASALVSTYLAVVLGNVSFTDTSGYHAVFADVSGLSSDSPVRIAGVDVGQVDSVSIYHGDRVKVAFDLDSSIPLTSATRATVRYKNLIGDRYLELSGGSNGRGTTLQPGATIPASRTSPALDLDTLLNGFKPLFAGLDPKQINAVSSEIVQVFQGESGTVGTLLATLSSLTATLADRDQLIGEVINNLDATLQTVSVHSSDLNTLIIQIQQLISGLAADRNPIGDALVHIGKLTTSATSLLTTVRPDLKTDIAQLGKLATALDNGTDTLTSVLNKLPKAYRVLSRLGTYGNFFNFYLCSTNFNITLPNGKVVQTPPNYVKSARCGQ